MLSDGLNWLCYFAGSSKSHRENSISSIFLESPYQVDMKNVDKFSKHFFGYFNTLETHSASLQLKKLLNLLNEEKRRKKGRKKEENEKKKLAYNSTISCSINDKR